MKRGELAGADLADLLASRGIVGDVALLRPMMGGIFAAREEDDPVEIAVTVATPNLFDVLGATPMLGRTIAANESGPGRPNLIVLTRTVCGTASAPIRPSSARTSGSRAMPTPSSACCRPFAFVRMDQNGVGQRVDATSRRTSR